MFLRLSTDSDRTPLADNFAAATLPNSSFFVLDLAAWHVVIHHIRILVNSQRLSLVLSRTPPVGLFTSQVPANRDTNKRQPVLRVSDYRPVDKNLLWIATPRLSCSIARISPQGQRSGGKDNTRSCCQAEISATALARSAIHLYHRVSQYLELRVSRKRGWANDKNRHDVSFPPKDRTRPISVQ